MRSTITAKDDSIQSPLSPKGKFGSNGLETKGIDVNQASIQPRPPRTSSAGKIRRPFRLKSTSAGKAKVAENENEQHSLSNNALFQEGENCVLKSPRELSESESPGQSISRAAKNSLVSNDETCSSQENVCKKSSIQDACKSATVKNSLMSNHEISTSQIRSNEPSTYLDGSNVVKSSIRSTIIELDSKVEKLDYNGNGSSSILEKENIEGNIPISLMNVCSVDSSVCRETSANNLHNGDLKSFVAALDQYPNDRNEIQDNKNKRILNVKCTNEIDRAQLSTEREMDFTSANCSLNNKSSDISAENRKNNIDRNNNEVHDELVPRVRPHKLPLSNNNLVFTFASTPRSPRSGKRKLPDSPVVDDVITPRAEVLPDVMVSLAEEAEVKDSGVSVGESRRNRGASLEDDFRKLSG